MTVQIIRGLMFLTVSAVLTMTAHAASFSSLYDMNRVLSEPHPLAHQYGTRWRPAQVSPAPATPALSPRPRVDPKTGRVPAAQPAPAPQPRPVQRSRPPRSGPAPATARNSAGIFSEIKLGALAHDVGPFSSNKEDGVDAHVELRFVSPDFLDAIWSPNPHIGADISATGDTSSVWLGLVWEREVWKKLFVGWSMGGAWHNGETDQGEGEVDEKELGCNPLFRLGLNVGWRFDDRHSIDLLLDHISNAKLCDTNEGLENFGVRYGYRF